MKRNERAGQRYGRLVAIDPIRRRTGARSRVFWNCLCDCGNRTVVETSALGDGRVRSCGCLASEMTSARSLTHGATVGGKRREYRAWVHAKGRCHNPTDGKYRIYGARGIVVCEKWRDDFAAFLADMGPCPPGLTLDRIDVNGNYEPGNCRWATPKEQANNMRSNVIVEHGGERLTLKQYAERTGQDYKALHARLRDKRRNK